MFELPSSFTKPAELREMGVELRDKVSRGVGSFVNLALDKGVDIVWPEHKPHEGPYPAFRNGADIDISVTDAEVKDDLNIGRD